MAGCVNLFTHAGIFMGTARARNPNEFVVGHVEQPQQARIGGIVHEATK
jgi:hypothetical protein